MNHDIAPPPGLTVSMDQWIELSRRVQRLECLIFMVPEVDLKKVDAFITSVLSTDVEATKDSDFSLQCEVYDMTENEETLCANVLQGGACEYSDLADMSDECVMAHDAADPPKEALTTSSVPDSEICGMQLSVPFPALPDDWEIKAKIVLIEVDMKKLLESLEVIASSPLQASLAIQQETVQVQSSYAPTSIDDDENEGECEKCGGDHASEFCPFFRQPREDHPDCWKYALRTSPKTLDDSCSNT